MMALQGITRKLVLHGTNERNRPPNVLARWTNVKAVRSNAALHLQNKNWIGKVHRLKVARKS